MEFLRQKLQTDFLDCITLDKQILLGNLQKESGTLILFDLIDHVKSDIATMDKKTWDILKKAEDEIRAENEKTKYILSQRRIKDAAERRDLELSLLREDYKSCKELLYFIQNLCWHKGWFQ